ncbi:MAG: fibrobacter succinogenes major paralogous domain-containing protein [Bacteroidota bacterium]
MKITINGTLVGVYLLFYTIGFAQTSDTKIGNQIWKTENLNVSIFRNGDIIKQAGSNRKWKKFARNGKPAWCYYENKSVNGVVYGKLYNWYAVNDPRGLSPTGWHIPDDKEWIALAEYLGGEDIAGEKMKTVNGWKQHLNNYSNGNNSSVFTAFPSGYRFNNGAFFYKGSFAYWWSSSEDSLDAGNAIFRDLGYNKSNLGRDSNDKRNGLAVRCIRD